MARKEFSRSTKRAALERSGLRCEAEGSRYGFEAGQRCNCHLSLGVQFDHVLPCELGGDNALGNCRSVCVQCHKYATANDIRQIRKSDRQRDRHTGVIRPAGTIKSPSFSKASKPARTSRHDWAPKLSNPLYEKETT